MAEGSIAQDENKEQGDIKGWSLDKERFFSEELEKVYLYIFITRFNQTEKD